MSRFGSWCLGLVITWTACDASSAAESLPWLTDLGQAQAIARQDGRLILVHFATDWCGPCRRLEKNVFPDPGVIDAVDRNFIPVKVDGDRSTDLVRQFRVNSYPTDVILTPDGQEVLRGTSSQDARQFAAKLNQVAASLRPSRPFNTTLVSAEAPVDSSGYPAAGYAPPAYAPPGPANRAATFPAANGSPGSYPPASNGGFFDERFQTYQPDPRANPYPPANGFGPAIQPGPATQQGSVAPFVQQGQPRMPLISQENRAAVENGAAAAYAPSNATPQVQHNPYVTGPQGTAADAGYQPPPVEPPAAAPVASSESPGGTIPPHAANLAAGSPPLALDGFCPVTLADGEAWVPGDERWGAIHRGQTYLFTSPQQQQKFLAAPDRYAPALIGVDPTLLIDQGQVVPGQRQFGMSYDNKIFLFSSEPSLKRFEQSPEFYAKQAMNIMAGSGR